MHNHLPSTADRAQARTCTQQDRLWTQRIKVIAAWKRSLNSWCHKIIYLLAPFSWSALLSAAAVGPDLYLELADILNEKAHLKNTPFCAHFKTYWCVVVVVFIHTIPKAPGVFHQREDPCLWLLGHSDVSWVCLSRTRGRITSIEHHQKTIGQIFLTSGLPRATRSVDYFLQLGSGAITPPAVVTQQDTWSQPIFHWGEIFQPSHNKHKTHMTSLHLLLLSSFAFPCLHTAPWALKIWGVEDAIEKHVKLILI